MNCGTYKILNVPKKALKKCAYYITKHAICHLAQYKESGYSRLITT
jgi:hypothetical protein